MTRAEEIASRCLREMLAAVNPDSAIGDTEIFREFQSALELLLPAELARSYVAWRYESLDAFRFSVARKVASDEVELIGLCLLISDQSWTPLHLRLRVASGTDQFEWIDLRLGEAGDGAGGMLRIPYGSRGEAALLHSVASRLESIEWSYAITRGATHL